MIKLLVCAVISITLIGCAKTSYKRYDDGSIQITCENWKAGLLCGRNNYIIDSEKTLECLTQMSVHGPSVTKNCTWQYEIHCKNPEKIPSE